VPRVPGLPTLTAEPSSGHGKQSSPNSMTTILLTMVGLYVLAMGVFLISENRRPQAILAWLLVFFFAPGD
jgi:hypothetical protein